ncbi:protein BOLA4, chloroplastic/mitochondrial [Selaginella moellendorffii]|nr:protein BOLA4, chloroplastic/mitochondrial [Selaginella moellendorffii]|eukprot:XP_002963291.2 protein BOLA4, chloroplastic/mitochondrial [Selaginella moellendorffii]
MAMASWSPSSVRCSPLPPKRLRHPVASVMERKIREKLGADNVVVKDAYGDGEYLSISVVASVFQGKSKIDRQKMVYKAVWDEVKYQEHVIEQIRMETPEEASGLEQTHL